jgi:hypothetical protein
MSSLIKRRPSERKLYVIDQEDIRGIDICSRRNKYHSLAPLGNKGERIHYPICPSIPPLLESFDQQSQCAAAIQVEHKGDVFEDDPGNSLFVQQPKDVANQAGPTTADARSHSGLAQILARKSGDQQFEIAGEAAQLGYIRLKRHIRKAIGQNCLGRLPDFAEQG